tara:strand:+ start:51 stop:179 length:129 start_codon:yes stop_codon:yes gene_type:complete
MADSWVIEELGKGLMNFLYFRLTVPGIGEKNGPDHYGSTYLT